MEKGMKNSDVRLGNKRRLMKLLYWNNGISKQDISSALRLSTPTVNLLVSYLEEDGLVEKRRADTSSGGRIPDLLFFKYDAKLVVGVEIAHDRCVILITDLRGTLRARKKIQARYNDGVTYWQGLRALILQLIEENGFSREDILGVGMGFTAIANSAEELGNLKLSDMFKRIGKNFISVVGGSSGVLYGSAYLEAAKITAGATHLTPETLCDVLEAMTRAIMQRGNAKPGDKTMVDSIHPAVQTFRLGLEEETDLAILLPAVKQAAIDGAESTKAMVAVKGRAYYQADRSINHIDPGAVTMSYQISILMDYALEHLTAA